MAVDKRKSAVIALQSYHESITEETVRSKKAALRFASPTLVFRFTLWWVVHHCQNAQLLSVLSFQSKV